MRKVTDFGCIQRDFIFPNDWTIGRIQRTFEHLEPIRKFEIESIN